MSKPVFYEFPGSVWCTIPKLAMSECGLTPPDITVESVNLAAGANFDPNGFLKINSKATVPVLEVDGKRYKDSTNVTEQIMKLSPNPPKKDTRTDHELAKVIQAVHSEKHDPVAMFFLPVDDAEREAKAKGFAGGYVASRQKALDKYLPEATGEAKAFLAEKQASNGAMHKLYTDSDLLTYQAAFRAGFYTAAAGQWTSAGDLLRGELPHILKKTPGKFLGGADRPGEADFHVIAWLARTVTNAGIERGQLSGVVLPALEKRTGGQAIDPIIGGYWDSWVIRPSFKDNDVH